MLFEDYWNKTCERNTAFKNKDVIEIKTSIIKKLMQCAYNEGFEQSKEVADRFKKKVDDSFVNNFFSNLGKYS